MPWGINDVEKHKKGLTAEQKRRWTKIANSILRECEEMKQENCEARAIKIANSRAGGKDGRTG